MTAAPPQRLDGADLISTGANVAVTPHYLASEAAIDVMDRGGNAVDGAIAANAVLGVVAPETCGIGGDLFALIHERGKSVPLALNASGRAGSGTSSAAVRAAGFDQIPIRSPWAVTVPGCVDGWVSLSALGALTLSESLGRAIDLAEAGFPTAPELAEALTRLDNLLRGQDSAQGLYPRHQAPRAGDVVTRPQLARTLTGIATGGRDEFYGGRVGEQLVEATGGVLQTDDLARSQAEWIDPISIDVMDLTGWTIPPNSQGYLTLAAAWIFEQLDPPRDPYHPLFTHAAVEAYRAVAWERDDVVADPDSAPLPPGRLLDADRLEERVDRITMTGRATWDSTPPTPGGTAYLCVRDKAGMGVSLIQSNYHGIGSGIGVGNAGFFLHDRGSGFSLDEGHPNELAPGKRPFHTLSPSLWTAEGSLAMLLGTRGGDFQPQTLLQMLTYMRWAGVDAAAAHLLPRWTTRETFADEAAVTHEPHLSGATVRVLEQLGHQTATAPGWMSGWGPVSVIVAAGDRANGAADPRVASTAALCSAG